MSTMTGWFKTQRTFACTGWSAACALALLSGVSGCTPAGTQYEVQLSVALELSDGSPLLASGGLLHVDLHHAYQGEGSLEHPLGKIQSFTVDASGTIQVADASGEERYGAARGVSSGEPSALEGFTHVFDYPLNAGTGLFVYVWEDLDGDGALCSPTERGEWAGGTLAEGFPAHDVQLTVILDAPCTGAEGLFPPAGG